jgi:sugar lactone lactonase YvrE
VRYPLHPIRREIGSSSGTRGRPHSVTADHVSHPDSFIFGGKEGVGIAKKESSESRYLHEFWDEAEKQTGKAQRMRANDGAVDSRGRVWSSAVCDPLVCAFAPEAVVMRVDLENEGSTPPARRVIDGGITIANGMSWSQDDRTFYFTDSATSRIYAYDFDADTGAITNCRDFFCSPDPGAFPDGHAQDVDGNFWVAMWGAWKVVRLNSQGEVTAEVAVPTRCPTVSDDEIWIG